MANENNKQDGKSIYKTHCALCHGDTGIGDGRMSKLITSPSPANLTESVLTKQQMKEIISGGGKAVGRSASMPPWEDQLSENEIHFVIRYIESIKKKRL